MQYKLTVILIFVLYVLNVIWTKRRFMDDLKDKEYSERHLRRLATDLAQGLEENFDGTDNDSGTPIVHEAFDSSPAKVDVPGSSKNCDSLSPPVGEGNSEDESINLNAFTEDEFNALTEELERLLEDIDDEEWQWEEYDEEFDENNEDISDSESGESEIDSNLQNIPTVLSRRDKLAKWAVECSINHNALDKLLVIIKNDFGGTELPSTGKYLVKTPKEKPVIKKIGGDGEYLHFGLQSQLIKLIPKVHNSNFEVQINVDGLPIAKSTTKSLWPILGVLRGTKIVFVIGIFYGSSKPSDSNLFMRDFVDEAKDLSANGFDIDNNHYDFCIKELILDAPAKSFLLKIKGHTGYSSCTKCDTEGFHNNRRTYFPDVGTLRTYQSFLAQSDWDFHTGTSILTEIPNLNIVTITVLDYMHLICLGVIRKLIILWIAGKNLALTYRLSYQQILEISNILETIISKNTPKEFVRKGRSFKYLKQFKATDRQLLLYSGVVAFKRILKPEAFEHYLTLVIACRILCSEKIEIEGFLDYSKKLLHYFVKSFGILYGEENISHNVHGLYHIVDDVKNHGKLDDFSAFVFENYLQKIKKLVRKPEKPLEQIFNRYHEELEISKILDQPSNVSSNLKLGFNETARSVIFNSFEIVPNSNADNCVLLQNGKVAIVEDAYKRGEDIDILVKEFAEINDLFLVSNFSSTEVGMYKVSKLANQVKVLKASAIVKKCFKMAKLGDEDAYAVATLLHSDKSE